MAKAIEQIQRYRVGYYTDDRGMSSNTPCLLKDPNGYAVRFEDVEQLIARVRELEAQKAELQKLAANFEITGPDDEGLLWLVLHGNGTTGKAMFNLWSASTLAGQAALLLEQDRRKALTNVKGGAA